MRWHTVGGRLRSTKHSRRLVKKRLTTDANHLLDHAGFGEALLDA
jgi:hypothetical protein